MSSFSIKNCERKYQGIGHQNYVARIVKSLYYGKIPKTDRLSLPVTELAADLFSRAQNRKSLERLHLDTAANISRSACVSPCCFILALLYLDKLKSRNVEYLERTNPSDLFLVSLMIASKFLFDSGEADEVYIDEWAASGEMTVPELVELEREFLKAIDWEIYVQDETFWKKLHDLETILAKREGDKRGFFTYTELTNLSILLEIQSLLRCIVTVTMIMVATYATLVLTISGSFFIVSHIPGNALQQKVIEDLPQSDNNSTSFKPVTIEENNREPVDLIQASLFLASLNAIMVPYYNKTNEYPEFEDNNTSSWEWWNVPSMVWLFENSREEIGTFMKLGYFYKYLMDYLELMAMGSKNLEVSGYINMNKATKTRIQDQLEGSWHKEWTDSGDDFFYTQYVQNIKL